MNVNHSERTPAQIEGLIELAQLLERIERNPSRVNAEQYRHLIARLSAGLENVGDDAFLDRLLATFPATAELYENLRYRLSGLSRTPLAQSVESELQTRELLGRLGRQPS